jgi:cell division transport system ATP-binding protein
MRNFGTVFQDFKLLTQKTVFENVAYAAEVIGTDKEEINKSVSQILSAFGLLEKSDKYPNQLSGGEQQRVSLARALVNQPDVVIADEPTGNLDPVSSMEIIKLLLKINDMGTTVILATHDNDIVNMAKKRVVTLDAGKIVSDQNPGKYLI